MSFKLSHIIGNKQDFTGITGASNDVEIIEEKPDLNLLLKLIERVGANSGWDKREVYQDPDYLNDLKDRIEKTSAHLYLFKKDGEDIGFCQTLEKEGLSGMFNTSADDTAVEIYKVGLFPEHIGKGLGSFYVSAVLAEIFKGNDVVYLSTRDSNVVDSIPFYKRLGLKVVSEETKPDDLTS